MKIEIGVRESILLGIFSAALVAANLMGTKIARLWIVDFSVGIFAYPVTFLITDIVEEVHGRDRAKWFVIAGFISLLFVFSITSLAIWLPSAKRDFFPECYQKIFGISLRIFIASIIAFLVSQLHDVWSFNFWKDRTKGRYLWLRNNFSTSASQFIDTVIFMFIAFYGVTPKHDFSYIFQLILPYWLLKVVVALLDTPICYLGVWWLRKGR